MSPPDKRAEAAAARAQITANSRAGKSDHLAIIAAFNGWTAAWAKGGRQRAHTVRSCLSMGLEGGGGVMLSAYMVLECELGGRLGGK